MMLIPDNDVPMLPPSTDAYLPPPPPPSSPCANAPEWIALPPSFGQSRPEKQEVLLPPHSIPLDFVYSPIPIAPLQNPTLSASNPMVQSEAVNAFQKSMQNLIENKSCNPMAMGIPPAVPSEMAMASMMQSNLPFYVDESMSNLPPQEQESSDLTSGLHELSLRAPRNRKEAELVDKWSIQLAISSLESELINETAAIWRGRIQEQLLIKWQHFELMARSRIKMQSGNQGKGPNAPNGNQSMSFDFNVSDQQIYDAIITDLITRCDALYLSEVRANMSAVQLNQTVGMLKGVMDGLRDQIKMASMRYPQCATDAMRKMFETTILPTWSSLLLIATNDIRNALRRYLCDEAFYPYFYFGTALNGELARYLEAGDQELCEMRDSKQQRLFMQNTQKQHNKMEVLMEHLTMKNHQEAMDRNQMVLKNMKIRKRKAMSMGIPNAPRPRKKRRKCRHHLFRKDGTLRKAQSNPCASRRCKKMWQTDGKTRGCGGGTHPRGVCPCWKKMGFSKKDMKDGTIQKWLEQRFGAQNGKFKM